MNVSQPDPFTLTNLAAILGMVLGTAGFVMGLMNYLRDRPRVLVTLQWDMTISTSGLQKGLVRVANVGRRPVFIAVVALKLPKGFADTHLLLFESVKGSKLCEGDAPVGYTVNYQDMEKYSKAWRKLRAYAEDSAGKSYYSKAVRKTPVPSWVGARSSH